MNPRPLVTLDHLPPIMRLHHYVEAMSSSERTVRRQLAAGTCLVPPRLVRPYRWARVDVEAYLSSTSLPQERRRLMRVAAASVLVLVLASSVFAQTVGPVVDKLDLGMAGWVFWPMEFDGDPATREWVGLYENLDDDQRMHYRVASERQGRLCVGPAFDPVDALLPIREFSALAWVRLGGIDALVLQGLRYYREFRFEVPSC